MSRSSIRPSIHFSLIRLPSVSFPCSALLHLVIVLAALSSIAANYGVHPGRQVISGTSARSRHFVVSAPTAEFAKKVCAEAERFRYELALEWLGHELPPWQDPCPIRVIVGEHLGAGGATSFTFINGQPRSWDMEIQGSHERILDSVLPHEITHTIMATHFGRPLPRWADEGAATSVEHTSERSKQDKMLIEFLTTRRGIAFNQMFAMKEYPQDILPLYSQGYSLARFLIAQGGKHKFLTYVGDGMKWNNWTAATQKHYGLHSLSELQVTWLDWVRQGSPEMSSTPALARAADPQNAIATTTSPQPNTVHGASRLVPLPLAVTPRTPDQTAPNPGPAASTVMASGPGDGWYSRQKDQALASANGSTTSSKPEVD